MVLLSLVPVGLFAYSFLGPWYFLAELVVNFRWQMLGLLLPFPVLLLIFRRFRMALLVGLVTLVCAWPLVSIRFPDTRATAGTRHVRLMTFNVLGNNRAFAEVLDEIRRADPDILLVHEFTRHWEKALKELQQDYPSFVLQPRYHGHGIGVYSRLPIVQSAIQPLGSREVSKPEFVDIPAIDFTVDVDGELLRLLAVHFTSPGETDRLLMRNAQMQTAARILKGSSGPTVVAGDFNCTPFSTQFQRLLHETGLRDSRQGFGYHATFPNVPRWARVPIDHVLVSDRIAVTGRRLGAAAGSDHLPVICDISFGGEYGQDSPAAAAVEKTAESGEDAGKEK